MFLGSGGAWSSGAGTTWVGNVWVLPGQDAAGRAAGAMAPGSTAIQTAVRFVCKRVAGKFARLCDFVFAVWAFISQWAPVPNAVGCDQNWHDWRVRTWQHLIAVISGKGKFLILYYGMLMISHVYEEYKTGAVGDMKLSR